MKISIFWFRRDLRLEDNTALNQALSKKLQVLPVFIFDLLFYIYLLYRRTSGFLVTSVGDRASVDKIVFLVLFPVPVDL